MPHRRLAPCLVLFVALAALAPARGQDPTGALTRIAFGSCANQDKPLPILDTIAATRPELFLLLGDNVYADLDKSRNVTPELIREKYTTLGKVPGFQKLKATCPILATWDDHDFGKNDAGADWALRDDAQRAFLDFFGVPPGDPRRKQKGVYHSTVIGPPGKRVQVILLDTRYFRSPLKRADRPLPGTRIIPYLPNTDADATVLGPDQWNWLEGELKRPAELRLLVSSIQVVSEEHPFEKWANIPRERERLYALIKSTGANGVILLSGDRHHGEISLDPNAVGYPLYDVTASGLNQAARNWRPPEKNAARVAVLPYGDHFGMVQIDWSGDDPRVTLQLRDEDGDVMCAAKVRLSTLRAAAVAGESPKRPEGVLSPAEAAKKVGEKVTVQFPVASTGGSPDKRLFLNSEKEFRAKENFTVMLLPRAFTGKWEKATGATFQGKTVRVSGTVKLYMDRPEIEVTDEKQIEIVEK
jgi:alkaline phosphatase D